jgi:uncharacterized protein (DUF2249 family)
MNLTFKKLTPKELEKVRKEVPARGFNVSPETEMIRQQLDLINKGEGITIDISNDWDTAKKNNKLHTKILSQIQWKNKINGDFTKLVSYFTPDKNSIVIENIPVDVYQKYTTDTGRFNSLYYRLGRVQKK